METRHAVYRFPPTVPARLAERAAVELYRERKRQLGRVDVSIIEPSSGERLVRVLPYRMVSR